MMSTRIKVYLITVLGILITGAILFIPAGSFAYWQGWLFLGAVFIPFLFAIEYFIKKDPGLLKRRMRYKEKAIKQNLIIKIANAVFFVAFIIPGLDYRFGWSDVPAAVCVISNIIIMISYQGVLSVLKANSYASRTVEVEKGQKVITTGPYGIVRHPMYSVILIMFLTIPTALGSYWALIPMSLMIPIIIFRLLDEEKILTKELEGYKAYKLKVKFRLIPGIW